MESFSARRAPYAIPDEPAPTLYQRFVVTPTATLLGVMLGGSLVGLPWMVFNGFAMGSAHRKRESVIALATLLATGVALALLLALNATGVISARAFNYLGLLVHALRLAGAYVVYQSQQRSFELYLYFGGVASNRGWLVAFLLMAARLFIANALPSGPLSVLARF